MLVSRGRLRGRCSEIVASFRDLEHFATFSSWNQQAAFDQLRERGLPRRERAVILLIGEQTDTVRMEVDAGAVAFKQDQAARV